MGLGPVLQVKHNFGLVSSNNQSNVLQYAIAVRVRGQGQKRLTHVSFICGNKPGTNLTVSFVRLMIFRGEITIDESVDVISDAYLLNPDNDAKMLYECGATNVNGIIQNEHYFGGDDILAVDDGQTMTCVLFMRSDAPLWSRLFANGCVTITE